MKTKEMKTDTNFLIYFYLKEIKKRSFYSICFTKSNLKDIKKALKSFRAFLHKHQ